MLAAERRMLILDKLQEEKSVVVSELSTIFQVSEETIRRDLEKLEKDGFAVKSYGGATFNEHSNDMPFSIRNKANMSGKQKIAEIIATIVGDGEHIILDPSTTAVAIARALKDKNNLTVITNSLEVLMEQPDNGTWEMISTGGVLREDYLALVGPRALEAIESYNVDKVIISCKGLSMDKGITDTNEMFSLVKQTMLKSGGEKILAADYRKFDVVGFSKICDLADFDTIVTDKKPTEGWLKYFSDKGIKCVYAEEKEEFDGSRDSKD